MLIVSVDKNDIKYCMCKREGTVIYEAHCPHVRLSSSRFLVSIAFQKPMSKQLIRLQNKKISKFILSSLSNLYKTSNKSYISIRLCNIFQYHKY